MAGLGERANESSGDFLVHRVIFNPAF